MEWKGAVMSKKEKKIKTNAIRMVEDAGIPYDEYTYEVKGEFSDGVSSAHKIGLPVEMTFKTLVLVGTDKQYMVCVIPVAEELDLKKAARHFKEKKLEMIHVKEINKVSGYIRGGCSPIGMKKQYPTAIDETALLFDKIGVSGGRIGLTICLDPEKLAKLVGAEFTSLTKE